MKIKMTETVQGSLDGETVQELKKGETYDTVESPRGDRLAVYHVETMGQAVYVKAASASAADEPALAAKASTVKPRK